MRDFTTLSPDEQRAEIARRNRNRAAGRAIDDDGPLADGADARILCNVRDVGSVPPSSRRVVDGRGREIGKGLLEPIPFPPDALHGSGGIRSTFEFELPWTALCPDNERWMPSMRKSKGRQVPVLVLSPKYRAAKKKAVCELRDQWDKLRLARATNGDAIRTPVRLECWLYEPNRSAGRDIANYAKLTHDCLQDAGVLANDVLIDVVTWRRRGVDIDRPRLVISLLVLPS